MHIYVVRLPSQALIKAFYAQGHAHFTRAAGSQIPCPLIDFDNGWNEFMAAAYQLPSGETIKKKFGEDFGAGRVLTCFWVTF